MPKRVDETERRELIAAALMRLAARDGLEAVSLRQVAAEAGVSAGMVQHWFDSKGSMIAFAFDVARSRYATRITEAIAELGANPPPEQVLRVLASGLIPTNSNQHDDARVALAFRAYAVVDPPTAARLAAEDAEFRTALAEVFEAVRGSGESGSQTPEIVALAIHALAEGLALLVLTGGLDPSDALHVLNTHLDRVVADF